MRNLPETAYTLFNIAFTQLTGLPYPDITPATITTNFKRTLAITFLDILDYIRQTLHAPPADDRHLYN